MTKNEIDRLKLIETELAYLRRIIEKLLNDRPIELHEHYNYDYSGMKPMIIQNSEGLKEYFDPQM